MKNLIAGLLFSIGVIGGLYFGLYWSLVLGIVGCVHFCQGIDTSALHLAISIVKILFCGFIGWSIFGIMTFISALIADK